jgi:hypothetical protein
MYADTLGKDWGGIIGKYTYYSTLFHVLAWWHAYHIPCWLYIFSDLTVEFPERCINSTKAYKLIASWDGVPASPEKLEEAATFAVEARKQVGLFIEWLCAKHFSLNFWSIWYICMLAHM